jgi:hypothetical protein
MIFVFGSNERGRHGAGAALTAARHYGAREGQGFGPAGDSFAIPTKDWVIQTLPLEYIKLYVDRFIVYARWTPEREFKVTALGTGLAGIEHKWIAQLFKYAPDNCFFDEVWKEFIPKKNFWGTFP